MLPIPSMQLTTAARADPAELRYLIGEVKAVKLYFVSTQRNAWHRVTVRHYAEGCMHSSFDSAKGYCEGKRKQGTVFCVDDLPALAFCSGTRAVVVTEIDLDHGNLFERLDQRFLKRITEVIPVPLMSLEQVARAFHAASPLWIPPYPRRDSAIAVFSNSAESLELLQDRDAMLSRRSHASGAHYRLRWHEYPSGLRYSNVMSLASALLTRPPTEERI